jgi:hypothetical protein
MTLKESNNNNPGPDSYRGKPGEEETEKERNPEGVQQ